MSLDDAVARLVEVAAGHRITQAETVSTFDALGRVLAQDVISPVSVPPHDNSAMDGYAFAGAQLVAGQPLTLRRHAGYDHGYYFIASWMADHLHFHAQQLAS
eukprot:gene36651-47778_t